MKKSLLSAAFLIGFSFSSFTAQAAEAECPQMKGFVDLMYEIADYLNKHPNFDENEQMEKDVDGLVEALKEIAAEEKDSSFSGAVTAMDKVWSKEEWTDADSSEFRRNFDSSVVNLERIYEKYCDK